MKKHAYLIMAHNQWNLLCELLQALDDSRNDIYLHIDKKSTPPLEKLKNCVSKSRLFFTKRYNVVWGGTQMLECTLNMLESASKQGGYSHFHLISGADYPLKRQDEIHDFFNKNPDQLYVGFDWEGIGSGRFTNRVQYYHFLINTIGKRDKNTIYYRALAKIEDFSLSLQKKMHINRLNYTMYKGSSWFSITNSTVERILCEKQTIKKRYRYTANSDEIWLQTLMMEFNFKNQLADNNMRYIKWIQGDPSPIILTMADYEDLISSDKLFARKFDWDKDSKIVLKLKEYIS